MVWGGDTGRRRNTQPTFAPPPNDLPAAGQKNPYSYVEKGPGYVECVVGQARMAVKECGAAFDDLFNENHKTEQQRLAREYFLSLDHNERAALTEYYDAQRDRFDVC